MWGCGEGWGEGRGARVEGREPYKSEPPVPHPSSPAPIVKILDLGLALLPEGGETGRVFGEQGWMEDTTSRGTIKKLPNINRPPLPPGVKAGGHGGSHGQLSNEFVVSILEDRKPQVDIAAALNMTVCGIVANQSALKDGELMKIPQYSLG